MSALRLLAVLLAMIVGSAHGTCPNVTALTEFDLEQFAGIWYETARYPQWGEFGDKCSQARYDLQSSTSLRVEYRGVLPIVGVESGFGTATVLDPSKPAELQVVSDAGLTNSISMLAADYTQGALMYNCNQVGLVTAEAAWILSRTPEISPELDQKYKQLLADFGSDVSQFHDPTQDCGNLFE